MARVWLSTSMVLCCLAATPAFAQPAPQQPPADGGDVQQIKREMEALQALLKSLGERRAALRRQLEGIRAQISRLGPAPKDPQAKARWAAQRARLVTQLQAGQAKMAKLEKRMANVKERIAYLKQRLAGAKRRG